MIFSIFLLFAVYIVVSCDAQTTGDGNSKKVAKKHAAENMLNELNKLPPLGCSEPASAGRRNVRALKRNLLGNSRQQVQAMNPRRRATNLVKGADTLGCQLLQDDGDTNNPVAALLRVQQLAKQIEPVYTVVEEHGQGRRKEFVMEVNCGVRSARGSGCSKKIAKRIAAKEMLDQLDESGVASAASGEFIIQLSPSSSEKARKVTFTESKALNENANQIGRQLVPGILLMSPESEWPTPHSPAGQLWADRLTNGVPVSRSYFAGKQHSTPSSFNPSKTAAIAKELLDGGKSPTAEAIRKQSSPAKPRTLVADDKSGISDVSPSKIEPNNNSITESKNPSHGGIRAADQLLYLADLLKFEVFHCLTYHVSWLMRLVLIHFAGISRHRFNSTISPRVITATI